MTVLVTGGAGYVGSHTARELHRADIDYVVLDNLERGHAEFVPDGRLVVGNIADGDVVARVFADHDIDAVLHFAAYAYVGESVDHPARYYRNNVGGTVNLLRCMVDAQVDRIVFSSTCATYGEPEVLPIPEEHPQRPVNPYGASKLMVERILQDFGHAYGLRSVSLRYFNAAGADPDGEIGERHDPETHLIPLVLEAAAGLRPSIRIFGTDYATPDGSCVRDYVHVNDLASAHVLALRHLEEGAPSDVFNLGNGNGYSVREVIDTARRVTGRPISEEDAPRRAGDPDTLVGSGTKARRVLGWTPQRPGLDEIIGGAWAWHQLEFQRVRQREDEECEA